MDTTSYFKQIFKQNENNINTDFIISENSQNVLNMRYYLDLPDGKKESTFHELCIRVSRIAATAEVLYTDDIEYIRLVEKSIYADMMSGRFLFNSPALFSAGAGLTTHPRLSHLLYDDEISLEDYRLIKKMSKDQMMFACFVIGVEDSIKSIFNSQTEAAIISQHGGGVGANFGNIREKGAPVKNGVWGEASGPITFMDTWNTMGNTIQQGGKRRAALMGMLDSNHPDIEEFIDAKTEEGKWTNFNLSVAIDNKLMDAVLRDQDYSLISRVNNNIVKTVKAKDLWDKICTSAHKRGDPGIFFIDLANNDNILQAVDSYDIVATNPCVTGDTLVAVADGRGSVSIKQLADDGVDVPVYTEDTNGNVVIRTMRNPRLTGKNTEILKVTLDNGQTIRCTPNHKFIMRDGTSKEAKDLQFNDSLCAASKELIPIDKNKPFSTHYWALKKYGKTPKFERRMIAENYYGEIETNGKIIHHVDFNPLNNRADNLTPMWSNEHIKYHSTQVAGDRNPMRRAQTEWSEEKWADYSANMSKAVSGEGNGKYAADITNDMIIQWAKELATETKVTFSRMQFYNKVKKETDNKHVIGVSPFRLKQLGYKNFSEFASKICEEVGCYNEHIDLSWDLRKQKHFTRDYDNAITSGYEPIVKGDKIYITKICEQCGNSFEKVWSQREVAYCTRQCRKTAKPWSEESSKKLSDSLHVVNTNRILANNTKQLEVYTELICEYGRKPNKKEFVTRCKEKEVSAEYGRNSLSFKTFEDIGIAAMTFNHRVVSVEYAGFEDVYNGTVDEFHTFYIASNIKEFNEYNSTKISLIKSRNCGEQGLPQSSACNLGSINIAEFTLTNNDTVEFDEEAFNAQVIRSTYYLDLIIDVSNFPLKEIETRTKKIRPVGLGIMGLADLAILLNIKYSSYDFKQLCLSISKMLALGSYESSVEMAVAKGAFPEWDNISDDIFNSLILDGKIESYVKARNLYLADKKLDYDTVEHLPLRNSRRLSIAPTGTISMILNTSSSIEPNFAYTWNRLIQVNEKEKKTVQHFHRLASIKNKDVLVTAMELSPKEHTDVVEIFASYIDAAISKTVNMPSSATVEDVKEVYENCYAAGIKGITIYRDGSRSGQPIQSEDKSVTGITPKIEDGKLIVRKRPKTLSGITVKNDATPFGSIYVVANFDDDDNLFEVFIENGRSGSLGKSTAEAMSRLISLYLRIGGNPSDIIRTLKNIAGDTFPWVYDKIDGGEDSVYSVPDAISVILDDILKYKGKDNIHKNKLTVQKVVNGISENNPTCPDCGAKMVMISSCLLCPSCGSSPCK